MDGIHDLGGRQGFGKVDVDEKEEAFHSDWEARAYGIVRAMSKAPDWTLDKFRFTREQIDPADYLTRPYYDQWLQAYAALMVGSGVANVDEIVNGHSAGPSSDLGTPRGPDSVVAEKGAAAVQFERPYDKPFQFEVGSRVQTKPHAHKGHTGGLTCAVTWVKLSKCAARSSFPTIQPKGSSVPNRCTPPRSRRQTCGPVRV